MWWRASGRPQWLQGGATRWPWGRKGSCSPGAVGGWAGRRQNLACQGRCPPRLALLLLLSRSLRTWAPGLVLLGAGHFVSAACAAGRLPSGLAQAACSLLPGCQPALHGSLSAAGLQRGALLQVQGFGRLAPHRRAMKVAAGEASSVVLTEAGEARPWLLLHAARAHAGQWSSPLQPARCSTGHHACARRQS